MSIASHHWWSVLGRERQVVKSLWVQVYLLFWPWTLGMGDLAQVTPEALDKFKLSNPSGCRSTYCLTVSPRDGWFVHCWRRRRSWNSGITSSMTEIRDKNPNQSQLWSTIFTLHALSKTDINLRAIQTNYWAPSSTRLFICFASNKVDLSRPMQHLTEHKWYSWGWKYPMRDNTGERDAAGIPGYYIQRLLICLTFIQGCLLLQCLYCWKQSLHSSISFAQLACHLSLIIQPLTLHTLRGLCVWTRLPGSFCKNSCWNHHDDKERQCSISYSWGWWHPITMWFDKDRWWSRLVYQSIWYANSGQALCRATRHGWNIRQQHMNLAQGSTSFLNKDVS